MTERISRAEINKARQKLVDAGAERARQGVPALGEWWRGLSADQRRLIGETAKDLLKSMAKEFGKEPA